jgi:hypothetical protein
MNVEINLKAAAIAERVAARDQAAATQLDAQLIGG